MWGSSRELCMEEREREWVRETLIKVLTELLPHSHGDNKVGKETSHVGFPLQQSAGTCLHIGYLCIETWDNRKIKEKLWDGFIIYEIYRWKNEFKAVHRGPTWPWGAGKAIATTHAHVDSLWVLLSASTSFWNNIMPRKNLLNPKVFFTSIDIDFLKCQKHAENNKGTGLIGLSGIII